MEATLFDHGSNTTFHNLSIVKNRHLIVCWKHEKQVSITWNKYEIQDTTTLCSIVWVLNPNNDISRFLKPILHDISSMGHLLVLRLLSIPFFLGATIWDLFCTILLFVPSTSGHFYTLVLVFSSPCEFFNIFPLMLLAPISCSIKFIFLGVISETITMLPSKANFHPGQ